MPDPTEVSGEPELQEPAAPAASGPPEEASADSQEPTAETLAHEMEDIEQEELELSEMEARLLEDMDRLQSERNDYLDQLLRTLTKEGLERIDPAGEQFDPNEADAVAHEDGDGGPVVAEVLRPGYRWKGRVLRPAMVKVRG